MISNVGFDRPLLPLYVPLGVGTIPGGVLAPVLGQIVEASFVSILASMNNEGLSLR